MSNGDLEPDPPRAHELRKLEALKGLLGEDIRSADKVELLASIEYVKAGLNGVRFSENDVVSIVKRMKPYFSEREIRESWQISASLSKL